MTPDANKNTNIRWYIALHGDALRWTEKTHKANGDAGLVDFFALGDTGYWWGGGTQTAAYLLACSFIDANVTHAVTHSS